MTNSHILTGIDPKQALDQAKKIFHWSEDASPPSIETPSGRIRVGVDLGTAYLVVAILDESGWPIAGEYQFAQVVRDGLVVDYVGAVDRLLAMKSSLEDRIGRELDQAASSFPPGVPLAEVRATANVVEAAGLRCETLIDEPTAANALLQIENGAIVDVGGGTTGIAIIDQGEVVYTADEATGGTHFSLVIAGAHDITFEEAEVKKLDPSQQTKLMPVVKPVIEKVASIAARHVAAYEKESGRKVEKLTMVGGTSAFPGLAQVVSEYSGIPAEVPDWPMFVTPLGIALSDSELV